jgi:hypothetical protein
LTNLPDSPYNSNISTFNISNWQRSHTCINNLTTTVQQPKHDYLQKQSATLYCQSYRPRRIRQADMRLSIQDYLNTKRTPLEQSYLDGNIDYETYASKEGVN